MIQGTKSHEIQSDSVQVGGPTTYFERAVDINSVQEKGVKALEDIDQIKVIIDNVDKHEITDQAALMASEYALEAIGARYGVEVELPSLESSFNFDYQTTKARLVSGGRRVIVAIYEFILRLISSIRHFIKETVKNSGTRRSLINRRLKAIKDYVDKNKKGIYIPIKVKLDQVALVANGPGLENTYVPFMQDMSESIIRLIDSPSVRVFKEIFKIYEKFNDGAQREGILGTRLKQLDNLNWITTQAEQRAAGRSNARVFSVGDSVLETVPVYPLPNNRMIELTKLRSGVASPESYSQIGYRLRERNTALTISQEQIFDLTDPAAIKSEVIALESLMTNLGSLMDFIRREEPRMESAQKRLQEFLAIEAQARGDDLKTSQESEEQALLLNALINSMFTFPLVYYQQLMNFTTSYTSLLTAAAGYR